ncbi:CAP domain-containing protein [Pseudozobellia thermophila]|uniref:Cysteine-rich secretory protein family protein n=1 Tax=Pseudozobellia thermophila TaxID=192903 RepID=A0A1M6C4C5_9FLAO|nr:CAP domain-containing protein [Pseudozobellia thermophila]SHI55886.1 Cysteine-rich secretory protein family protein [Pseudozobellia thermophila]
MRYSTVLRLALPAIFLMSACSKDDKPTSETEELSTTIDTSEREAALALYEDYYMASSTSASDVLWTGDEPSCTLGSVPQNTKDRILGRLHYFRKAVGLNNVVAENSAKSEKAQAAALMMHANGSLEHYPPDTWKCFSEAGKEAAANSLLTSAAGSAAIDSYIRDQGAENGPVGHRRWLLWPRLQEIGIGNTDHYNALWVIGDAGTPPADAPEFIAWPPEGFVPKQVVYPRWSFSIANADFEDTKVSMRYSNGSTIAVETEELSKAYADNTIVWQPDFEPSGITKDTSLIVSIQSVGINGEATDFEYEVILFDATNPSN